MTSVCGRARLDASLALDRALGERRLEALWEHLGSCPSCAAFAAELGYATTLVRSEPLEPVRPELSSPRVLRSWIDARRGPWTSAALVAVAVVLGTTQLPSPGDGREAPAQARSDEPPLRLPIGQRSAAEDFVPWPAGGVGAS